MVPRAHQVSSAYNASPTSIFITQPSPFGPCICHNMCEILLRQIERDCEFLEAERIMDYSLLVGLHFRDDNTCEKMGLSPFLLRTGNQLHHPSIRNNSWVDISVVGTVRILN